MQILWNDSVCPAGLRSDEDLSFDSFTVLRTLGSGSLSQVFHTLHKRSNTAVALKVYAKDKLSELSKRQIIRELEIHITLNHPAILACYGAFESSESLYLMLEYAPGGDLFHEVKKKGGKLPEKQVVTRVLYPVMSALDYLHENDIMHRDLKPENLVSMGNGDIKLCDFGLSINVNAERPVTRLGTLDYMSPEILRCPKKRLPDENKEKEHLWYTKATDVWAIGVLAYELLTGKAPFEGRSRDDVVAKVTAGRYSLPPGVSSGAVSFIESALQVDPHSRPSMGELIQHVWIRANMSDLTRGAKRTQSGQAYSGLQVVPPPPPPPPQARKPTSRMPSASGQHGETTSLDAPTPSTSSFSTSKAGYGRGSLAESTSAAAVVDDYAAPQPPPPARVMNVKKVYSMPVTDRRTSNHSLASRENSFKGTYATGGVTGAGRTSTDVDAPSTHTTGPTPRMRLHVPSTSSHGGPSASASASPHLYSSGRGLATSSSVTSREGSLTAASPRSALPLYTHHAGATVSKGLAFPNPPPPPPPQFHHAHHKSVSAPIPSAASIGVEHSAASQPSASHLNHAHLHSPQSASNHSTALKLDARIRALTLSQGGRGVSSASPSPRVHSNTRDALQVTGAGGARDRSPQRIGGRYGSNMSTPRGGASSPIPPEPRVSKGMTTAAY